MAFVFWSQKTGTYANTNTETFPSVSRASRIAIQVEETGESTGDLARVEFVNLNAFTSLASNMVLDSVGVGDIRRAIFPFCGGYLNAQVLVQPTADSMNLRFTIWVEVE